MKALITAILIEGGMLCNPLLSPAQTDSTVAIAVPLKGIVIDGKLDDWPSGREKHWILHHGQAYGPTDIDDADLKTSADLSPSFMVGYSPDDNLLYLAITVRDDVLMSGYGLQATDGCEIYVEGTRRMWEVTPNFMGGFDTETMAAMQYILCPPGGSYDYKQEDGPEPENPKMTGVDITKTKTRCTFSRTGDISIFEWAIEVYDRYPGSPTGLVPGRTIGLDVVINDVDDPNNAPAWVCWGTYRPLKFFNAQSLGKVLISDGPGKLGGLAGLVTDPRSKKPYGNFDFEVYRAKEMLGTFRADSTTGRYSLQLPAGSYAIQPKAKQGVETKTVAKVTVRAGRETVANFTPRPAVLPSILTRSATVYRNLAGYRDSTIISLRTRTAEGEKDALCPFLLAFARPNKLRFECLGQAETGVLSQYSDGADMVTYLVNEKRFMRNNSPGMLDVYTVDAPVWQTSGNMLDLLFFMNEDPLPALTKNTESIREIGKSILDGESVTGVEIIKTGDRFLSMRPDLRPIPVIPRGGALDTLTVWFGNRDALIRKISFRLDIEKIGRALPEQMRGMFKGTADVVIRHKNMELNPAFAENAFAFEAPEGAVEMRMYYEPEVSTAPKKKDLAGKPAPDFTLKDVDGRETSLSECRGNVVVLDFWAALNEASVQTMELVQKIHQRFEGKGVRVIGVNEFEDEAPDAFRLFLKEHGITHRILLDTEGTMVEKYGFTRIPACFVIDKKGIIRQSYTEKPDGEELARMVEALLKE